MAECSWEEDTLYVLVFNVGRGLAIFIRTPGKFGLIYDLGLSDDFSLIDDFLVEHEVFDHLVKYVSSDGREYFIPQIILSHPHNDHIGDVQKLERHPDEDDETASNLNPHLLTCPHDNPPADGQRDERFDFERMGDALDSDELKHYRSLFAGRTPPLQTLEPTGDTEGFEYGIYYVRPPVVAGIHDSDQDYINGSSVCLYLKFGSNSMLIPGDITPEVLERILDGGEGVQKRYTVFGDPDYNLEWSKKNSDQPSLKSLLKKCGLTVLVAPHHGLESSYSEKLYEVIKGGKPDFVVISEKRKSEDAAGTVDSRYQSEDGSVGVVIDRDGDDDNGDDGGGRHSLGTRSGYHIGIAFPSEGEARYYARSDADDLLAIY